MGRLRIAEPAVIGFRNFEHAEERLFHALPPGAADFLRNLACRRDAVHWQFPCVDNDHHLEMVAGIIQLRQPG